MIYEPREDSYLMKKAIEGMNLEGKTCLDMGTGSGIQAEAMLDSGAEKVVAADINSEASEEVPEEVNFVESDLFENVEGSYDLIVFNPPYLPGNKDTEGSETWKGGETGIEITERFLDQASDYLSEKGVILFIVSSLADFEDLNSDYKLSVIDRKKLSFEELLLIELKE